MRNQRLNAVTLPDYIPKSGRHNNWGFNPEPVFRHAVGHADLLKNLHGAAGEHNGAAAFRYLQFRLQHHARHTMTRQLQGGGQPRRACSHDDHFLTRLAGMHRRQPGLEHLVAVVN